MFNHYLTSALHHLGRQNAMKNKSSRFGLVALLALAALPSMANTANIDAELQALIRAYDAALYDSANKDVRIKSFDALIQRAERLVQQHPTRGEPLVWKGLAQAEKSGAEGSLSLVKQARKTLESAVAITPNAYAADAYSGLGSIYANVPGFPIGFGDKKKAREYFHKALAINAASMRVNVNYAQLLFKQDDYAGALKHATVAINAPPRAGREKADKAARETAESLIVKAKANLR